jgi:hypothetical protein
MKKIGILTFHKAINYGAVLQAYALQKKVMDLGFDAELIDYGSVGGPDAASSSIKKNIIKKLFKYVFRPVSNFRHVMRRVEVLLINRAEDLIFKKVLERQKESFSAFKKNHLKISKNSFHTNKELESLESIYDGVITGSDQVWNPLITQYDLAYFLNFVSDNNKKISYAASFGSESIPDDFQSKITPELQSFKHLSVREAAGAVIIKNISNRDAQVVADPTLLLSCEEWREIIPENKINEPYIFCYAFLGNRELKYLCKYLAKITGFKIVRLSLYQVGFQRTKEYFDKSITNVNDSGPLEFLSYLNNASMVVTNSFHGAIFSINFKKDFFVISPEYNVDRVVNILDLYKLSDRLQKKGDKLPTKKDIKIDYSVIEPIFVSERNKSIEFLRNSLNSL